VRARQGPSSTGATPELSEFTAPLGRRNQRLRVEITATGRMTPSPDAQVPTVCMRSMENLACACAQRQARLMPEITAAPSRRALAGHLRAAYAALCRERAAAPNPRPAPRRAAARKPPGSGALSMELYDAYAAQRPGTPTSDVQRAVHGSWSAAKRAAGLRSCGAPSVSTTAAEVRHHLRAALSKGQLGRDGCLSQAEYTAYAHTQPDAPNLYAVTRCLGSWSLATAAIGASPRWPRHSADSDTGQAALLADVRAVAAALGHAPSCREYDRHRAPGAAGAAFVGSIFGGWNAAIRAAGLTPAHKSKRARRAGQAR
jgi:hypothetical protein